MVISYLFLPCCHITSGLPTDRLSTRAITKSRSESRLRYRLPPSPPPSAALILDSSTDVKGGRNAIQNAAIAGMEVDLGNYAVSGSRTIRVDVKSD